VSRSVAFSRLIPSATLRSAATFEITTETSSNISYQFSQVWEKPTSSKARAIKSILQIPMNSQHFSPFVNLKQTLFYQSRRKVCALWKSFAIQTLVLSITACSGTSYMGIPLQPDSELSALAREAKAGEKNAQYQLGMRFENGDQIPSNQEKARKLYFLAATPTGGSQITYVPTNNGVKPQLINRGPLVAGIAAAREKLVQRNEWSGDRTQDISQLGSSSARDFTVPDAVDAHNRPPRKVAVDIILDDLVRIELFSDRCLSRQKGNEPKDYDAYALDGWNCLLESTLPSGCGEYLNRLPDIARSVRYFDKFALLRRRLNAVINNCQSAGADHSSKWPAKIHPTFLDIELDDLGQASRTQKSLVAQFRSAQFVHSDGPILPGYAFETAMCRMLTNGQEIRDSVFWLLACQNDEFVERQRAATAVIDEFIEKGGNND
jgi:hypothetical protein